MSTWLSNLSNKNKSAQNAKERLKLVLIHDRTDINSSTIDEMKDDIIEAISHHVSIDPQSVEIRIMHEGREQRLVADIPLNPKR